MRLPARKGQRQGKPRRYQAEPAWEGVGKVPVKIAGQIAGQIALSDPPRRLSLGVPPQTGAEQSALGLKETGSRGTEGKEGEP
jgi:hypothetical protein